MLRPTSKNLLQRELYDNGQPFYHSICSAYEPGLPVNAFQT